MKNALPLIKTISATQRQPTARRGSVLILGTLGKSMKSSGEKGVAGRNKSTPQGKPQRRKRSEAYHHGALRDALLEAAESILIREGIQGLTLRASAREAGVS